MLEKYLIDHCSPTLARVKAANLFNAPCSAEEDIDSQLTLWNRMMDPKGVKLLLLRRRPGHALIYVYRKKQLEENLNRPGVARFLRKYGYVCTEVEYCLSFLKERFAMQEEFPHEIGIFLDYPLGDVIGFIENGGQNYKCAGCWKVYCNECEALKLFQKYRKCRNIYRRLWESGRSVLQLTVAA